MAFIPVYRSQFRQVGINHQVHNLLWAYFNIEISEIELRHRYWLKYPIQEFGNQFSVTCAANDIKVEEFLQKYPQFKLIKTIQIYKKDISEGVRYLFEYNPEISK